VNLKGLLKISDLQNARYDQDDGHDVENPVGEHLEDTLSHKRGNGLGGNNRVTTCFSRSTEKKRKKEKERKRKKKKERKKSNQNQNRQIEKKRILTKKTNNEHVNEEEAGPELGRQAQHYSQQDHCNRQVNQEFDLRQRLEELVDTENLLISR